MNTVAAPSQASRSQVIPVPDWVRSRPRLVFGGLAAALLLAAGAFGQPWLETLGVGSVVLSFLPCAAMCAAGLCMKGGRWKLRALRRRRHDSRLEVAAELVRQFGADLNAP